MKLRVILVLLIGIFLFACYFIYSSYAFIFFVKDHQLLRLTLQKDFFSSIKKEIVVEVVKTPNSITQGLSGRTEMKSNNGQAIDGLLFVFPNKAIRHFWMKDMFFNLDICWLDNLTFIECQRLVQKDQASKIYNSPKPVNLVLETKPGFLSDEDLSAKLFFK